MDCIGGSRGIIKEFSGIALEEAEREVDEADGFLSLSEVAALSSESLLQPSCRARSVLRTRSMANRDS